MSKRQTVTGVAEAAAEWGLCPAPAAATTAHPSRFEAVMAAADRSGLLAGKGGRIGGRISPELVARAKAQTGIDSDSDLIAFALANIAVEDRFAQAFAAVRGAVDADLNLGF